jgi:hypothetical protein
MAEERVQRRLAAIRATGVVGYSRLMEEECRQWALASSIAVLSFTNFSGDGNTSATASRKTSSQSYRGSGSHS